MSWEIVLGLISLFSFGVAVVSPIIKLNTNIIKLNDSLNALQEAVHKLKEDIESDHKRMWEHNDAQDTMLEAHERRITNIEHTMDITEKLHPELVGIRPHDDKQPVHLNATDSKQ